MPRTGRPSWFRRHASGNLESAVDKQWPGVTAGYILPPQLLLAVAFCTSKPEIVRRKQTSIQRGGGMIWCLLATTGLPALEIVSSYQTLTAQGNTSEHGSRMPVIHSNISIAISMSSEPALGLALLILLLRHRSWVTLSKRANAEPKVVQFAFPCLYAWEKTVTDVWFSRKYFLHFQLCTAGRCCGEKLWKQP